MEQLNENQWQTPPQPPMQPNKPKKKRTWLWVIIAIIILPMFFSKCFENREKQQSEKEKTELPTLSKESWTENLLTDLNIQNEYLDSIPVRLKGTKSLDMLRAYVHDTKNIADKVITDSTYMDVYSTPEVVKLMDKNSVKAKKILPEVMRFWRKRYVSDLSDKLWEENIYVECPNGGTTITFIGAIFASNKNIKQWQEQVGSLLGEMGFKQVRYKWIKHADDYTYYDL